MALEPCMLDSLYGSRPGRYAAQVWSKLLWCVEESFHRSIDLSGMVADLQKAFNMLPRLAVFEIAAHMGLPPYMLVGWAGALAQMKRRFVLRGSLTAPVPSVTGFPEGCGLSCVAMLLLDSAFHAWHKEFFPLCMPISYVDDWQLICPHSSLLAGPKKCLDAFVLAVDLTLDPKKSFTWSLTTDGRKILRQQGFTVVLAARNLGAHVQLSKKHTNSHLMDRIGLTCGSKWDSLIARITPRYEPFWCQHGHEPCMQWLPRRSAMPLFIRSVQGLWKDLKLMVLDVMHGSSLAWLSTRLLTPSFGRWFRLFVVHVIVVIMLKWHMHCAVWCKLLMSGQQTALRPLSCRGSRSLGGILMTLDDMFMIPLEPFQWLMPACQRLLFVPSGPGKSSWHSR